jgi:hypothetical protein
MGLCVITSSVAHYLKSRIVIKLVKIPPVVMEPNFVAVFKRVHSERDKSSPHSCTLCL